MNQNLFILVFAAWSFNIRTVAQRIWIGDIPRPATKAISSTQSTLYATALSDFHSSSSISPTTLTGTTLSTTSVSSLSSSSTLIIASSISGFSLSPSGSSATSSSLLPDSESSSIVPSISTTATATIGQTLDSSSSSASTFSPSSLFTSLPSTSSSSASSSSTITFPTATSPTTTSLTTTSLTTTSLITTPSTITSPIVISSTATSSTATPSASSSFTTTSSTTTSPTTTSSTIISTSTTSSSLSFQITSASQGTSSTLITTSPTTTITSSVTATAPVFSCPQDDGSYYTDSNGNGYQVQCSTGSGIRKRDFSTDYLAWRDMTPVRLSTVSQSNFASCLNTCQNVAGCIGVTFAQSSLRCTYQSSLGTGGTTVNTASPTNLTCPDLDGYSYLDAMGSEYVINCNTSFPASSNITSSRAYSNITSCTNGCSNTTNCLGASFSNGTCTFVSSLNTPNSTKAINATMLVLLQKRTVNYVSSNTSSLSTTFSLPSTLPALATAAKHGINPSAAYYTSVAASAAVPVYCQYASFQEVGVSGGFFALQCAGAMTSSGSLSVVSILTASSTTSTRTASTATTSTGSESSRLTTSFPSSSGPSMSSSTKVETASVPISSTTTATSCFVLLGLVPIGC